MKNKNNYKIFDLIPGLKSGLSKKFHQSTKIDKFTISPGKWPDAWLKTFYKGYSRFSAIKLNEPTSLTKPFDQVLIDRESTRKFSSKPINFQELSNILYYSGGENKKRFTKERNYRFYASGGARYPFEIYPIIRKKSDINEGLYHYYVRKNLLEVLPVKKIPNNFVKKSFGQPIWTDASVFIVISAIFSRTQVKYKERGYRVVMMDLGHLCQNIYLVCSALNIGCCETNGFNDSMFNDLLDIDGWRESVLIVMALGHKNI